MVSNNTSQDNGSHTKETTEGKATRRRVLKGLSSGAVVAPFAVTGSAKSTEDPVINIVTGRDERVKKSRKVPRDWWAWEQRVERAQNGLRKKYNTEKANSEFAVDGVGIGTLDERIDGYKKSDLTVYIEPDNQLNVSIPDTVDGIPINQETVERPEPDSCNSGTFDPIPGGVEVASSEGTTTCMVQKDYINYIMTANHVVGDNCQNVVGDSVYQPDGGQYVGDVAEFSGSEDWAIIPADGNVNFSDEIEDVAGRTEGKVTKDGLKVLKSDDAQVYLQGSTTCGLSETITDIDVSVSPPDCPSDSHYVKTDGDAEGGDSGAPHYHQYVPDGSTEFEVAIIAPHYGSTDTPRSYGCAAYHISNAHDITFNAVL